MTRDAIVTRITGYIEHEATLDRRVKAVHVDDLADSLLLDFAATDARIAALLAANNEYLLRARAAERRAQELLVGIAGCARLVGQLAPLIDNDG